MNPTIQLQLVNGQVQIQGNTNDLRVALVMLLTATRVAAGQLDLPNGEPGKVSPKDALCMQLDLAVHAACQLPVPEAPPLIQVATQGEIPPAPMFNGRKRI